MTPRKTAPTIADLAEAERFYNRVRTYHRQPGDADIDAAGLARRGLLAD